MSKGIREQLRKGSSNKMEQLSINMNDNYNESIHIKYINIHESLIIALFTTFRRC